MSDIENTIDTDADTVAAETVEGGQDTVEAGEGTAE
jgi:hypothetical protein